MNSKSKRTRRGSMDIEVETSVEVESYDVVKFIKNYANDDDLQDIAKALKEEMGTFADDIKSLDKKTLNDIMKDELLVAAFKKFSLTELEEKLGNKFDLM